MQPQVCLLQATGARPRLQNKINVFTRKRRCSKTSVGHMSNMPRFSSSCPMSTCSNLMSDFFSKHSLIASCNRSPTLLIHSGCSGRPCCVHGMPYVLRSCVSLSKRHRTFTGRFKRFHRNGPWRLQLDPSRNGGPHQSFD